jgi:iron complex outermembrane receptor protein
MTRQNGQTAIYWALAAYVGLSTVGTAEAQTTPDNQVDVIVITAQKRSESAQEVPVSVTAVSGDDLTNSGVRTATQIASLVPNLAVSTPYSESQPEYSLRGISVSDFSQNQQSPIALYVDEVYKGVGALQSLQIYDIERLEVLRGPQGTLYGRNATGGAISFFTRGPEFDAANGYVTVGAGNYGGVDASAAYGQQIVDDVLAFRVAGMYQESDGYVEELTPGFPDRNGYENWAVRGSLRFNPVEDFDAVLRVSANRAEMPGGYGVLALSRPGGVGFTGYDRSGLSYFQNEDDKNGLQLVEGRSASLTMNWDFSPDWQLASITSYDHGEWTVAEDADGSPFNVLTIGYFSDVDSAAQELRLSTTGTGPFKGIFGVYASREALKAETSIITYYNAASLQPDGTPTCLVDFFTGCRPSNEFSQIKTNLSAYGNVEYAITDDLSIIGGLRYSQDELNIGYYRSTLSYLDPTTQLEVTDAFPLITAPPISKIDDSNVSGKIGFKYTASPDVMVFGSFSTGYRGSSLNAQAFYAPEEITIAEPETLDAWELGFKSDLFDRSVRLNATTFYYDYKNQQFLDVTPNSLQVLVNAPAATLYGLEVELTAKPTADITLHGGAGYTHSEYDELLLRGFNLAGNQLIGTPKVTFSAAADWVFYSADGVELTLHGDTLYTSRKYYDAFQDDNISQAAFWLTNARFSASFDDGAWVASIWAKNLTDEKYTSFKLNLQALFNYDYTQRGAPRTYGVELTHQF